MAENEITDLFDSSLKVEFIEAIKQSGFCWLSLEKINRFAALSIRKVDETVDNIMLDLLTKKEVDKLIEELAPTILEDLEKENKITEIDMSNN